MTRTAAYRVETSQDGNDLTIVFDEPVNDPIAALKTPAAPVARQAPPAAVQPAAAQPGVQARPQAQAAPAAAAATAAAQAAALYG